MKRMYPFILIVFITSIVLFVGLTLVLTSNNGYWQKSRDAEQKIIRSLEMLDNYQLESFTCVLSEDENSFIFRYEFAGQFVDSEGKEINFKNWGIMIYDLNAPNSNGKSYMSQDIENDEALNEMYQNAISGNVSCTK